MKAFCVHFSFIEFNFFIKLMSKMTTYTKSIEQNNNDKGHIDAIILND